MKISFVILAHNEEKLLGKCLKSVLKETAPGTYQTEIIVVDNASTDGTREAALQHRKVTVVEEPFKGKVQARRAGFLVSTGDLVANIDADTELPRGWLQKVMDEFERDETLVALSGPLIYRHLDTIDRVLIKIFYVGVFLFYLFKHYVLKTGVFQSGNFVIRRAALLAAGGYNISEDFYGEDAEVARRISKVGEVKWLWGLPMYASGRQFKKGGVVTVGVRHVISYFNNSR